jgi:hypothetical protein
MLVATITATAPTWGAWTALWEEDANAVWYVDPESIRVEGPAHQVWAMKDVAQPVTDFDLSMELLYEVDCAGRRHRLVQLLKSVYRATQVHSKCERDQRVTTCRI